MTETHPPIETVTEPLAVNTEQRMAANAILEEAFITGHPAEAETMARLEAAAKKKHAAVWHAVPWIMVMLALACVVSPLLETYLDVVYSRQIPTENQPPPLPAGVTEQVRLLLGDPAMSRLERTKRLHLSDTENPAYFAEYVQAWMIDHGGLPPGFLEIVSRIAPDNAFFLYLAAAATGGESIDKKKYTGVPQRRRLINGVRLPPLPREVEYDITDRAAFDDALGLIAKAAALPAFETYTNRMIAARIRHLPSLDMAELAASLSHVYSTPNSLMSLRKVVDLTGAGAEELSKSGRKDEFIALAAQRDALLAGLARNPDIHLVGELMHAVIAAGTATQFNAAADRLGLAEMAEKYRKQADALQEEKDRRAIRSNKEDGSLFEGRGASLNTVVRLTRNFVTSPPPIEASRLEPMRMVEHEFLGGLGVLSVAILLLVAALVLFLLRFFMPHRIRVPAKLMARVIDMADWCWVLLLGVVFPIALFLVITRLTPLGGRDYGFMHFLFAFPGVHLIALSLGLLLVPAMVMRWRLSQRLAPFGFTNHKATLSIAVTALLLVPALFAYPFLVRIGLSRWTLGVLAVPSALVLCLILVNSFHCLFGKPIIRLFKTTTAIAVLPAYAIAIIALCLLMPIYHSAEKRWMAKDTLTRIDPEAADLGAYEFKIAAQKRREITAITGFTAAADSMR
jgi:hypothetical protein